MKMILVLLACIAVGVQAYPPESRLAYSDYHNHLYHGIPTLPYVPQVPVLRNIYNPYNVHGYRTLPIANNYYGRDSGQYYHG